MEAEKIIEKKIYEENGHHDMDRVERKARNGFGMGLAGVLTGGAALLNQWGGGRGLFGGGLFGGNSMPENININTAMGGAAAGAAPTSFQAWEKACEAQLALTNEMWGLKMNTLTQMYDHRQTDVAEKFSMWKGFEDGQKENYKAIRDLYDNTQDKLNSAAFGLYKGQRDLYDLLNERYAEKFNALDKEVAMLKAVQPYQNRIIQCEIEKAYTASINHADRLDCRNIKGVVTLPNTPTVTGFPTSCGCNSNYGTTTTGA